MTDFLAPPPSRTLHPARRDQRKGVLMNEIASERNRSTYRRRRRRFALAFVPVALLGVAAASYALLKADEAVASGIGCYDEAHMEANVTIVSTTGESPEEVCGGLWAQGVVKHGTTSVPQLMPCLHEGGAVYVFPSSDGSICMQFGLQDLPEGYEREAKQFIAMRDDVVRRLYESATAGSATDRDACLVQEVAIRIAREALLEHGFRDWSVEPYPGVEAKPCANFVSFDDQTKRVLITPSEPGIDPDPFGPH